MAINSFTVSSGAFTVSGGAFRSAITIDSFEGGKDSDWLGETTVLTSSVETYAVDGDEVLRKDQNGNYDNLYHDKNADAGELPEYHGAGKEGRFYFHLDATDGRFISRAGDDDVSEYNVRVWYPDTYDRIRFYNEDTQLLEATTVGLSANTVYYIKWLWDDGSRFGGSNGDHTLTCHRHSDDAMVANLGTVNDTSYTGDEYQEMSIDQMATGSVGAFEWLHTR